MPKFEPVLSVINAPESNLAKFLIPTLEPLTLTNLLLKIPLVFLKTLKNIIVPLLWQVFDIE